MFKASFIPKHNSTRCGITVSQILILTIYLGNQKFIQKTPRKHRRTYLITLVLLLKIQAVNVMIINKKSTLHISKFPLILCQEPLVRTTGLVEIPWAIKGY